MKTKTKTRRAMVTLVAVLVVAIMAISAAAATAFIGRVGLFKGHIKSLGAVSENQKIAFMTTDRFIGDDVDIAEEEVEFPVLKNVEYDAEANDWVSGKYSIGTPESEFKIASVDGVVENLRCYLEITGTQQLADTVRVGLIAKYPNGETKASVLHGFKSTADTDISVEPYSFDIGSITDGEPVIIKARVWIDHKALKDAGVYGSSDMQIKLVVY